MKISVHTLLFNYIPEKYHILDAFTNWSKYADEIVVATLEDQVSEILKEFDRLSVTDKLNTVKIRVVSDEKINADDPLFVGKLKNLSLRNCSNDVVIQQDFDERIGGLPEYWEVGAEQLRVLNIPAACFVPVIDLYKDFDHYKSIGTKWYLTKKEGVYRGPVTFAKKENGLIDTDKSDTCEAINHNGELLPSMSLIDFMKDLNTDFPHVVHLGYLDLEQRIEHNKFWGPVWSARSGKKVEVATDLETLEKENEAKPHGLKQKWWR